MVDRRTFLRGLGTIGAVAPSVSWGNYSVSGEVYTNRAARIALTKPASWRYVHPSDFHVALLKQEGGLSQSSVREWIDEFVGVPLVVVSKYEISLVDASPMCAVLVDQPYDTISDTEWARVGRRIPDGLRAIYQDVHIDHSLPSCIPSRHRSWRVDGRAKVSIAGQMHGISFCYIVCVSDIAEFTFAMAAPESGVDSSQHEFEVMAKSIRVW